MKFAVKCSLRKSAFDVSVELILKKYAIIVHVQCPFSVQMEQPEESESSASNVTRLRRQSTIVIKTLTDDEIVELREIFNLVDEDRGGTISENELKHLLTTVGIQATETEIDKMVTEMMADVDVNGDGVISVCLMSTF